MDGPFNTDKKAPIKKNEKKKIGRRPQGESGKKHSMEEENKSHISMCGECRLIFWGKTGERRTKELKKVAANEGTLKKKTSEGNTSLWKKRWRGYRRKKRKRGLVTRRTNPCSHGAHKKSVDRKRKKKTAVGVRV